MVCIDRSKVLVDRDVWLNSKGTLCRGKTELVLLDAHVALVSKYNDLFDRQCQEWTATNTELKRKDRQLDTGHRQSIFLAGRHRRVVLQNVEDMPSILKYEFVEFTLHPWFTKLYNKMFHLAKYATTEKRGKHYSVKTWMQQRT